MEPVISVIIPVRNEEQFLAKCLDSIINAEINVPYEILIIDGMSTDSTDTIIDKYRSKYLFISRFKNIDKIVPVALNIGIKNAKGRYISRIDAHSIYPSNYLQTLFDYMERNACVANVGVSWETLPSNDTSKAAAIAIASSHPLGIGNAQYRLGCKKPLEVDTVPFGFYRKEIFDKYGLFDVDLVRNQDDEYNHRLIKAGERIVLLPNIKIKYYARNSFFKLAGMFYQYGYFKPLVARKLRKFSTSRQLVPLGFFLVTINLYLIGIWKKESMFAGMLISCIYVSVLLVESINCIIRRKAHNIMILEIFLAFFLIHLSYATGYLRGIFDFWIMKRKTKILPMTR